MLVLMLSSRAMPLSILGRESVCMASVGRRCRVHLAADPRGERMQCHGAALRTDGLEERIHATFSKAASPSVRLARARDSVGMHPPVS